METNIESTEHLHKKAQLALERAKRIEEKYEHRYECVYDKETGALDHIRMIKIKPKKEFKRLPIKKLWE